MPCLVSLFMTYKAYKSYKLFWRFWLLYFCQLIYNNLPDGWDENNPLLLDPENGDFSIPSNSPAVNTGSTTSIILDDFESYLRNDGNPDIGAYEYQYWEVGCFVIFFFDKWTGDFKVTHSFKLILFASKSKQFLFLYSLLTNKFNTF